MPKRKNTLVKFVTMGAGTRPKVTAVPLVVEPFGQTLDSHKGPNSLIMPDAVNAAFGFELEGTSATNSYCGKKTAYESRKYSVRKAKQISHWTSLRDQLHDAYLQSLAPSPTCDICNMPAEKIFCCEDCILLSNVCQSCIESAHEFQPLHQMYVWKNCVWVFHISEAKCLANRMHSACTCTYNKLVTVVDAKGRHHSLQMQFCSCEEESVTMIRHHLWPSSPKSPRIAFDFHLMEMLRVLYLQVPVPVKDFCEALKYIYCPFLDAEDPILQDIYKVLINESFEEYRFFVHQLEVLARLTPSSVIGDQHCPACPQTSEYQRIFSMDANFGLVRKKSSGTSTEKPKHAGKFFIDQASVDDFVAKNSMIQRCRGENIQDCNDFKAGNNIRSKRRHEKLDETAVFGASCRHDIPQLMFSLKHGERLAYPVYLLNQLLEKYGSSNFYVMYDIACMLEKHIMRHHPSVPLEDISLAIPIFHCYGHKMDCQMKYSPRRLSGYGLSDGENLERLWSYLRNFSKITKEMTPTHRVDTLSDALTHYTNRIVRKLGASLVMKMEKAIDVRKTNKEEVNQWMHAQKTAQGSSFQRSEDRMDGTRSKRAQKKSRYRLKRKANNQESQDMQEAQETSKRALKKRRNRANKRGPQRSSQINVEVSCTTGGDLMSASNQVEKLSSGDDSEEDMECDEVRRLKERNEDLTQALAAASKRHHRLEIEYRDLLHDISIRCEYHKRCVHEKMAGQVSKYSASQVYEAIYRDTLFEPDTNFDNIVVPSISVKVGSKIMSGSNTQLHFITFGDYTLAGKIYPEGQISKAQREYQVLVCLNEDFMPFPIGLANHNKAPVLVMSMHSNKSCFCVLTLEGALNGSGDLQGIDFMRIIRSIAQSLSSICKADYLYNNLSTSNVLIESTEVKKFSVVLCGWGMACCIDKTRILSKSAVTKLKQDNCMVLAPEVSKRERGFSVASEMYCLGIICNKVIKHCEVKGYCFEQMSEIKTFSARCLSPNPESRPDRYQLSRFVQSLFSLPAEAAYWC